MNGHTEFEQQARHGLVDIPLPNAQNAQVNRTDLIRLLADGMRDLGYSTAAVALERESGTSSSSQAASEFLALLHARQYEAALLLLDVLPFKEGLVGRYRAKTFIVQERYLDSLLEENVEGALARLHSEVYFLNHEEESDLDDLASMLACPSPSELKRVSGRLRAKQAKRLCGSSDMAWGEERTAIDCIRILLDTEAVVPPQRLLRLLGQALARQAGNETDLRTLEGEPLPLLRDLHEVEEERSARLLPSSTCRLVVPIKGEGGPVEVWCVCIEDNATASRVAIGTKEGSVLVLETLRGGIIEIIPECFGRNAPIVSLDWVSPFGLLAISRDNGSRRRGTVQNRTPDGDEMEEEESNEEGEEVEAHHRNFVKRVLLSPKELTPQRMAFHLGRPTAKWLNDGGVITSGVDGWLRVWSPELTLVSSAKVERVVDMAPFPDRSGVFVACADNTIRGFRGNEPCLSVIQVADSISSIACGFNSLVASLKGPCLEVWNLKDVFKSRLNHPYSGTSPLVFKGFSRRRYVLHPSVGAGDFIATGSEDGNVHIYSCFGSGGSSNKESLVLRGHSSVVNDVCFAPRVPGTLVSAGDDGSIRIWTRKMVTDDKD